MDEAKWNLHTVIGRDYIKRYADLYSGDEIHGRV